MTRIRLDAITFDAGTQIRAAIDQQVVSDYAEQMTEGAVFPPIVLFHDGNRHYLADGFHRFMAAQRNTFVDIDADVRAGTQVDALWFALGANKQHGKQLTASDKRNAIAIAIRTWPSRSGVEIAAQVGCSDVYVSRVRKTVQTTFDPAARVVGRDGKSYPAAKAYTPRGQMSEQRAAVTAMAKDGATSGEIRKALGAHTTLVAEVMREIGRGSVDKSKHAIQQRRERMRAMAAEGYTSKQIAGELGLSEDGCRVALRKDGVDVPADRVTGKTRRLDADRIIEQMVADAENLTSCVNLIDFADIDRERLGEWVDSLIASKKALSTFINRLIKEQQKHGEAA